MRQRIDGRLEGGYLEQGGDKCEYAGDLMQGYACVGATKNGRNYRYQGAVKNGRFEGLGELEVHYLEDQSDDDIDEYEATAGGLGMQTQGLLPNLYEYAYIGNFKDNRPDGTGRLITLDTN